MDLDRLVVHEDARLIALNKPAGLPSVHAGFGSPGDRSLHALVSERLGSPVYIVHRLDRPTSGLIVFAKDRDEHRRLSVLFESREVRKTYLAVVSGEVESARGEIDLSLRTFGSGRVGVDPRGVPARTRYELKERLTDADLLTVFPETGRRHQIRVHLNALGHPVLGDPLYGRPRPVGGVERLMLHAMELELTDATGAPLVLRAAPDPEFEAVVEARRKHH